ncbi:GGDEF and EAL domain-containing protein [Afipia massiliensis]|uniref:GGDEF and EAL domain-containing protein n=1 Tax=Afipia massiliensis TaxID=211460 RepID=A0A4U6BTE5_9BRAD|nr:EAL domain-containing protein [Afipia massiliensis]TKT73959.1 GGDEF and EAL domain-containing protein [Afipia massiliensis]
MLKVYNCIATAHDLWLVGLAAVICTLASFAAISLLRHARRSAGRMRPAWLAVSAISTGFGIWSTHFIAMLAFSPGIPSGYNIALTILSLAAAVLLTGAGLAMAMRPEWRAGPWLGGAVVGGGIATMHYLGMAAFQIAGVILWDSTLVAVSILLGTMIGATSLPSGLHASSQRWRIAGALLLTLAICSHHFTAMGAVAIIPDPTVTIPPAAIPAGWLAIGVAVSSFTIILLALGAAALDIHDQRRSVLEADRMRGLANAAIEGLLVCDGDTAVTANTSFAQLVGSSSDKLIGARLETYIPNAEARAKLLAAPNQPVEAELRHVDGSMIPVELILRPIDFGGQAHHVIAVRNLQARKKAEQHIRYLAHHDALTSLPNRGSFHARLDHEIATAKANGQKCAVLCFDLDRFKEINDLFGHAAGDKVLQTVASRVSALLDNTCMVARLGGDEFAVLMPELSNPAAAGRLADAILAALQPGANKSDSDNLTSCSIGIAICPDDADNREALLTHADTALYRAKTEGRSTYRFFEARMGAEVHDRRVLEHDLRQAVARCEFNLVYQPQEDIQTRRVVGFEALLRWTHKSRGSISPAVFIPIAEETGAILGIGEWVLREACQQAASWPQPLTIAVNVSAVQIYSENFVQLVHEVLLETGLTPDRLELEITETALVRDLNRALNTLRRIKALGVHIAMDDFGTGYSSLSNLRAFPFDKIKIDGSFIKSVNTNAQAATIVRAVLGLGRGLGLPVLAEGVETPAELAFLQSELCNEVQGYLVGRPAPIATFAMLTHADSALATGDDVRVLLAQSA